MKPAIVVYCERLDNESFCESVIRELGRHYVVRTVGPGWPSEQLEAEAMQDARFYLELDSASGVLTHPQNLGEWKIPKFGWLIDTHKKPGFHHHVSRDLDLTFYAMKNWGHVLAGRSEWLPLHCDTEIWKPVARERDSASSRLPRAA